MYYVWKHLHLSTSTSRQTESKQSLKFLYILGVLLNIFIRVFSTIVGAGTNKIKFVKIFLFAIGILWKAKFVFTVRLEAISDLLGGFGYRLIYSMPILS